MIVTGRDEEVADWVASQIPYVDDFGPCRAVAIVQEGKFCGGVVYHGYRPEYKDIQMTIATVSPRWATKNNIGWLFSFPFVQYGCERITAMAKKKNRKSRDMLRRLGFTEEGKVRKGFGDDDCMIYGMLKHECKFIGATDGEICAKTATGT